MTAPRKLGGAGQAAVVPVVITGVGVVTAVGFDAPSTVVAVRAGISRIHTVPDFATDAGAETAGGIAAGLTDDRSGSDRLLAMAIPALQEALEQAEREGDMLDMQRGSLLLALPPTSRPAYERFDDDDLADLVDGAECDDLKEISVLPGGHTMALRALATAADKLRAPGRGPGADFALDFVVVGGADCLLDQPVLTWLDASERLRTDEHGDGLMPGEAAAFLVLEREDTARARGATPLARVGGFGFATESQPQSSAQPSRAAGLSGALAAVIGRAPERVSALHAILCDLNGESYRMREWAMAHARELPGWSGAGLIHPVENHGDVGAASGATLAAMAVTLLGRPEASGGPVLVWCSADDGDRGVLLLEPTS